MPIFVMRQFVRHRTFRLNEESARYHKMAGDFFIPKVWRSQDTKNKQGSLAPVADDLSTEAADAVRVICEEAYRVYELLISQGISREQARMVLPVNLMTTITVNIDLHNLMHFFVLRLDSHAQHEIRVLASAMFHHFRTNFPSIATIFESLQLHPKNITPIPVPDLLHS